jgi:diguanylate cyclase (GGDEF)-like protein
MAGDASDNSLKAAFRAEVRRATRQTAVAGGVIAIVGFPAWAIFDHLVDPSHGGEFTLLRLMLEIPLVALWLSLFTAPGRRHPELVMLLLLGLVQGAIAFMVVRVESAYAPYALGMSLPVYASSFLLIWPPRFTAGLIALTWASLGVAVATAPHALGAEALATIGFYLATASLIAFVGQLHRQRSAWEQFRSHAELETEQARNRDLVKQLERLSREDALTGLANRRAWDETLEHEFQRASRLDSPLAVVLCDLDRLKEVNDRFGHETGDAALCAVSDLLRERVRATDLVARLGGDEFAVLCPDTDLEDAQRLGADLQLRFADLVPPGDVTELSVSLGVASRKPYDLDSTDLVRRADLRLYEAKRMRPAARA